MPQRESQLKAGGVSVLLATWLPGQTAALGQNPLNKW